MTYVHQKLLKTGAFSQIYSAIWLEKFQKVALKKIPLEQAQNENKKKRKEKTKFRSKREAI